MRLGSNHPKPISKQDIGSPLYVHNARTENGKLLPNPPLPKLKISQPTDGQVIPESLRGAVPPKGSRMYETAPGVGTSMPVPEPPQALARTPVRAEWMSSLGPDERANQMGKQRFLEERLATTTEEFKQTRSVNSEISMHEADQNLRSFLSHGDLDLVSRTSPTPHLDNARARREVVQSRENELHRLNDGAIRGMQKGEPAPRGSTGYKETMRAAKRDLALAKEHLSRYEKDNGPGIQTDLHRLASRPSRDSVSIASREDLGPTIRPEDRHAPRPKQDGHVGFSSYARHSDGGFGGIKDFDGTSKTPGRMSKLRPISQEIPNPMLESYPLQPGHVDRRRPGQEEPAAPMTFPRGAETAATSMGRNELSPLDNLRDIYRTSKNDYDTMSGGSRSAFTDAERKQAKAKVDHYRKAVKSEMQEAKRKPAADATASTSALDRSPSASSTGSREDFITPNLAGMGVGGPLPANATRLERIMRERDLSLADVAREEHRFALDPSEQNRIILDGAKSRVARANRMIEEEMAEGL